MRYLFVIFSLPLQVLAQDITGLWTGYIRTSANTVPYEVVIHNNNERSTGYSLTVFSFNGVENIGLKSITIKNKNKKVYIEDGKLIYDNYTTPPTKTKMYANLYLKVSESLMRLSGTFYARTLDMRAKDEPPIVGTITLTKQKEGTSAQLLTKLEELNLLQTATSPQASLSRNNISNDKPSLLKEKSTKATDATSVDIEKIPVKNIVQPAAEINRRKIEVIKTIFIKSDSVTLSLYDNGEIDGDTVSVVLNGKIIIPKAGLSARAVKTTIFFSPAEGDSLSLLLYAENLGKIPPNTGLLIVQNGDERAEIRFSGDFQKSAGILMRRRK
ncbi:MAG: hypothetical protein ICV66_02090 [Chitinophagaceae bacterium]|nr:hypothetical protein [Chitinophagaceae bacterium]